jgi:hypothetical protein
MEPIYVKLKDKSSVFQETEQRLTIVGTQIMKAAPSKRVSAAIRGGVLVEASKEEIEAYEKEAKAKKVQKVEEAKKAEDTKPGATKAGSGSNDKKEADKK